MSFTTAENFLASCQD